MTCFALYNKIAVSGYDIFNLTIPNISWNTNLIRMKKMIIYRIYHKESGKSYIGKCVNGVKRVNEHFRDFKNPNKEYRARLLYRAMKKYGQELFGFEILCEVQSVSELNTVESSMIIKFDSMNPEKGYNIRKGGDGGDTYSMLSNEEKIIRSKNLSEGIRQSFTPERRIQLSETLKKTRQDPEKSDKNRKMSSERLSRLNKDPEFRLKSKRNKKIKCVETGEIFNSIKELAAILGMKSNTVQWRLSKKSGKIKDMTYLYLNIGSKDAQ